MTFVAIMFTCSSLAAIGDASLIQRAWIDYRNIPGGPFSLVSGLYLSGLSDAGDAAFIIGTWFSDAMMVIPNPIAGRNQLISTAGIPN
jgi:hypothetical protein